ncbi:SpoIIE family protein phosphatase, partial [Nonomuraea sp. NPDC002799]
GALLQEAAGHGRPLPATGEPRVLNMARPETCDPQDGAAFDYLNRLSDGCVALDLEGRVTFASATAADLLGCDLADLRGKPLWEAAAWLCDPVFEDRCRAAVVSQQPTSCMARCPDGRTLEFVLYPDPSGISLRITPALGDPLARQQPAGPGFEAGERGRANVFYNFLHMAAALTRAFNVREVIDLVADHVMPVCQVKAMAILVGEGGRMRVLGSHGYDPEMLDRYNGLPLDEPGPARHVMRNGEAVFFADQDELRQMFPGCETHDDMAAWAYLPLIVSDRLVGACVLAFDRPHVFSDDERATLTTLAGLMAQALDRALVYDTKDRLAHSLQTTLLPRRLPEVPGLEVAACYVPATRGVGIGGDFYDLIRLSDTKAAAVIGDVQGHNMTAAALMGQVRTAIHAHAAAGADPGEVLRHTNRLLIDLDTDLFTSCLLIHLDLRLRTICAASAGHPPPLMRPPNTPTDIMDVPAGLLLGIDPDADYETLQAPFPPGAALALYTDGLVEAPGTDLDDAIAGLAALFTRSADEPLQRLSGILLDHAEHTRKRADDIALLLLGHRPN